jgi:acyl-CoA reductase-like NAD-dependent aldehyde dehydrogenase
VIERRDLFIGGEWIRPDGVRVIDVHSPATEAVIGSVPEGNSKDVDRAVVKACDALEGWMAVPAVERGVLLQKVSDELKARIDEVGYTICTEVGMPIKLATRIQAGSPVEIFSLYAKLSAEFDFESRDGNSVILRDPVGVVAAITPWNYPLHQIAAKVAPALAAGCTVVLKPSEVAPLNAFLLADVMEKVGLPAGVFNLVTGYGPVVGEALATHPNVDLISFTGSTRAGKRVAALAAEGIKRVTLELGGKSASIILEDADLAAAVKGTVNSCFLNSGQTCNAQTRMLVPESKYAEASKLAVELAQTFTVGDPLAGVARLGPLTSAAQRDQVQAYIRKGINDGAELLTGGPDRPEGIDVGYYVNPTVFGCVTPDSAIAQEEIFGPVLSIITYDTEEDAIRIANGTPYGLGGGVWSADEERSFRVARKLRTGQVDINGAPFNYLAPFGGFRQSGYGRELGRPGLEEYLEYKSIQIKPD